MQREPGHRRAVPGDPPGLIEGAELDEQTACLGEGGSGRWVEPAKLRGIRNADGGEVQGQRCQVRLQDLRGSTGGKRGVFLE